MVGQEIRQEGERSRRHSVKWEWRYMGASKRLVWEQRVSGCLGCEADECLDREAGPQPGL